jgi:hypothetical protein
LKQRYSEDRETLAVEAAELQVEVKEYTSSQAGFELTTSLVIGTDCTGSCKSNFSCIFFVITSKSLDIF